MRKSHLTAYKLSLASIFIIVIATIYIHNPSSAVSALDILIVYLFKYLFVRKISGVQSCFLNVLKCLCTLSFNYYSAKYKTFSRVHIR